MWDQTVQYKIHYIKTVSETRFHKNNIKNDTRKTAFKFITEKGLKCLQKNLKQYIQSICL